MGLFTFSTLVLVLVLASNAQLPSSWDIAVTHRAFQNHPDFDESVIADDRGIVGNGLFPDRTPTYVATNTNTTTSDPLFDEWWRDKNNERRIGTFKKTLSLSLINPADGIYSLELIPFFPLNELGSNYPGSTLSVEGNTSGLIPDQFGVFTYSYNAQDQRYFFTTELHTHFVFTTNDTFTIYGNDDIFLYINEKLALDLGGTHDIQGKTIELNSLGLVDGQIYTLDLFHANRHTPTSNLFIQTDVCPDACPGGACLPGPTCDSYTTNTPLCTKYVCAATSTAREVPSNIPAPFGCKEVVQDYLPAVCLEDLRFGGLATQEIQSSFPAPATPLFNGAAFMALRYNATNATLRWSLFVDGVAPATISKIKLRLGNSRSTTPNTEPVLFDLSATAPEVPGRYTGVLYDVNITVNNLLLSNPDQLYFSVNTPTVSLIGQLQQDSKLLSGSLGIKGSYNIHLSGGLGSYVISYVIQYMEPVLTAPILLVSKLTGNVMATLGRTGDPTPLIGSISLVDDLALDLVGGAAELQIGADSFAINFRSWSTFKADIVTQDRVPRKVGNYTFEYSKEGKFRLSVFLPNNVTGWTQDFPPFALRMKVNTTGTPQFTNVLTFNQYATPSFNWFLYANATIPLRVFSQIALGFATGSLDFVVLNYTAPLPYDNNQFSGVGVCRGIWFVANHNSFPVRFSLARTATALANQNGYYLLPYSYGFFTVNSTTQIHFKIASQTASTKTRQFITSRRQNDCVTGASVCGGRWHVYPSVLLPLPYSWAVFNGTSGSRVAFGTSTVDVTKPFQQIDAGVGNSSSLRLMLWVNYNKLSLSLPSAKKHC